METPQNAILIGLDLKSFTPESRKTVPFVQLRIKISGAHIVHASWIAPTLTPREVSYGGTISNTTLLQVTLTSISGHVLEDLSPYTCVYPDCGQPDTMYVTTDEWREHIRSFHSTSRWICDACWLDSDNPEDYEFSQEEGWRHHSLSKHSEEITAKNIDIIAKDSQRRVAVSVACPLCDGSTTLLHPDRDKHITEHLLSFASKTFPWDTNAYDIKTIFALESDSGKFSYLEDPIELEECINWYASYSPQDFQKLADLCTTRSRQFSRRKEFKMLSDTWNEIIRTLFQLRLPSTRSLLRIDQLGEAADVIIRLNTIMSRPDNSDFVATDMRSVQILGDDLEYVLASLKAIEPKPSASPCAQPSIRLESHEPIPISGQRQPDLQIPNDDYAWNRDTAPPSIPDPWSLGPGDPSYPRFHTDQDVPLITLEDAEDLPFPGVISYHDDPFGTLYSSKSLCSTTDAWVPFGRNEKDSDRILTNDTLSVYGPLLIPQQASSHR